MNKLFTKIGVAFVGIAMAIGVGVAVGHGSEVKKAEASTTDVAISLSSFDYAGWSSGSYDSGIARSTTIGGITIKGHNITKNNKNQPVNPTAAATYIQMQNTKGNLYNTTAMSDIQSITIVQQASSAIKCYFGNSGQLVADATSTSNTVIQNSGAETGTKPSTGTTMTWTSAMIGSGKTYFAVVAAATNYITSITVTYGASVTYTAESIRIEDESLIQKTYFSGQDWNNSSFNVQLVKGGNDEPKTYQYVDLTENLSFVYKNSSSETMATPATASGVTLTITSSDYPGVPAFVSFPFNVSVRSLPATYFDLDLTTDTTDDADVSYLEWDKTYVYMLADKAEATTNANNYYPGTSGHSYTSTRFYKNSVLTISPVDGYPLVVIDFEATTEGYATALANSDWTNATAEVDGTAVRVIAISETTDIECTIAGNCGFSSIRFYYDKTWCRQFLDTFTCSGVTQENPNGSITVANSTTVWTTLASSLSEELKATLKTLEADVDGTVNQQAMARYDLIIRKYGSGTYSDYIGRFSEGGVNYASRGIFNEVGKIQDSTTLIIVVVSLVSLTAIGGYILIRRRKEQ